MRAQIGEEAPNGRKDLGIRQAVSGDGVLSTPHKSSISYSIGYFSDVNPKVQIGVEQVPTKLQHIQMRTGLADGGGGRLRSIRNICW